MKSCLKLKKRISVYFSFFLLAGLAAMQGVAGAVPVMPEVDFLPALTEPLVEPSAVAIDQQGKVYVAETEPSRVTVFSQSGKATGNVIGSVQKPICVAVDGNGRILVGARDKGSVYVFGPDLGFLFKLGNGDGEFGKPRDIAVDASGIIYVVDETNHTVRTFDTNGAETPFINKHGNGSGQLHHPISIAIDENANEVIVLDLQQVKDPKTALMVDGARMQYFTKSGVFLRGYSKYGYNNAGMSGNQTIYDITKGQVTKPKKIAVDEMSRVYLTDTFLRTVMVYDNYDNYLGNIFNPDSQFQTPMGMAISASGRLYVTSLFAQKVEVFGLDTFTALEADPLELEFNVALNGSAADGQEVTLTNTGNAAINLNISATDAWITYAASTETLVAGETATLTVSVTPEGMDSGAYTGSITVDTGSGATEKITVIMKIESMDIAVNPSAVNFNVIENSGAPDAKDATITNTGTTPVNLTVSASSDWIMTTLSATALNAGEEAALTISVDPTGKDPGVYAGSVTVDAGSGITKTVDVILTVESVSLTADPSQLQFVAIVNGNAPESQNVTITNTGTATITLAISSGQNWISAGLTNATLNGGDATTLTVSVNPSGMGMGEYPGSILVDAGAGAATIDVTLIVGNVNLAVNPSELEFKATRKDANPEPQEVTVTNTGITPVQLTATATDTWVTAELSTAALNVNEAATLTVSVNPEELKPGKHTTSIEVDTGAGVSKTISVTLIKGGQFPWVEVIHQIVNNVKARKDKEK